MNIELPKDVEVKITLRRRTNEKNLTLNAITEAVKSALASCGMNIAIEEIEAMRRQEAGKQNQENIDKLDDRMFLVPVEHCFDFRRHGFSATDISTIIIKNNVYEVFKVKRKNDETRR